MCSHEPLSCDKADKWIILNYSEFTQSLMLFVDHQVAQWSCLMTFELWKNPYQVMGRHLVCINNFRSFGINTLQVRMLTSAWPVSPSFAASL